MGWFGCGKAASGAQPPRLIAPLRPDGEPVEEEGATPVMTRTEAMPASVKQPTLILRATIGMLGPDRGFILTAEEAERLRDVIGDGRVVEVPETNHYTIVRLVPRPFIAGMVTNRRDTG
jgi:hypothetical protein